MAELPDAPEGHDLEDLVAAVFQTAGFYIDKNVENAYRGVTTLEMDVIATKYGIHSHESTVIEVKGGKNIGFGDVFKLLGWMTYLQLPRASFVATGEGLTAGKLAAMAALGAPLGIDVVHGEIDDHSALAKALLRIDSVIDTQMITVWRYVYTAERGFIAYIQKAAATSQLARRAKEYHRVINNEIFFERDAVKRATTLYAAHFDTPDLVKEAATEVAPAGISFSTVVGAALKSEEYPFVHACMYLKHRGRLALLKAAVDRIVGVDNSPNNYTTLAEAFLPPNYSSACKVLAQHEFVHLYPVFWQVFTMSWGGFILEPIREQEYAGLATQTGIPPTSIGDALDAFDILFGGVFRTQLMSKITIIKFLPAAIRGLGAFNRLRGLDAPADYTRVVADSDVAWLLGQWHQAAYKFIHAI